MQRHVDTIHNPINMLSILSTFYICEMIHLVYCRQIKPSVILKPQIEKCHCAESDHRSNAVRMGLAANQHMHTMYMYAPGGQRRQYGNENRSPGHRSSAPLQSRERGNQ